MSRGRRIWYAVIISLLRGVMRVFWITCRVQPVIGAQHLDRLRESGEQGIIAYWHQMHLMCSNYLLRRVRDGDRIGFLISPSVSGEVPAAIARRWGARVIRGSSSRTGGEALRDLFQVMRKEQVSPVISPDGPKGPVHEFKTGAILLARMARAPIIPMACAASHATHWNSWDRFLLPWPFSRVVIAVGEPIAVPRGGGVEELAAWQSRLEAAMQATEQLARAALDQ